MDPNAGKAKAPGRTAAGCDAVSDSGLLEDAQSLWDELLGSSRDHFRLAALEAQQAGESLVVMIKTAIIVAALLSSAWMGLMSAAVAMLVEHGVAVSSAILLAVAANLLLALLLCSVIRRNSRYLRFPATLRGLQPRPPRRQEMEKSQ